MNTKTTTAPNGPSLRSSRYAKARDAQSRLAASEALAMADTLRSKSTAELLTLRDARDTAAAVRVQARDIIRQRAAVGPQTRFIGHGPH